MENNNDLDLNPENFDFSDLFPYQIEVVTENNINYFRIIYNDKFFGPKQEKPEIIIQFPMNKEEIATKVYLLLNDAYARGLGSIKYLEEKKKEREISAEKKEEVS